MKDLIYGAVFSIVLVGFAYAADQRIDQRVQEAIDNFNQQQIEQRLQFYIIKTEMTGLTGEDRINQQILERQLEQLRSQ